MPAPFREYDVENFDNIQSRLISYVLETYPNKTTFWNHVDQDALFEHVPELNLAIVSITGQMPQKTYLLVVPESETYERLGARSLHRDTSIESCRLNWPVSNSSSIETRFFNSTAEPKKLILATGETYLNYQEHECQLIDSFLMTKPTLLHVHTIHGLYRSTGPLPRYILSFKFENSIDHLLHT